MPIVTLTENDKPTYYAVTSGDECRLTAVVEEYKLSDHSTREVAEHALRTEYLRRLTEHAYDCAQLAHLVENPPDEEDLLSNLKVRDRLAARIAESAVWLRTYDPFTALIAEVVAADASKDGGVAWGTKLQIGDEKVSSLDDDSWEVTARALYESSPWYRAFVADRERREAESEARAEALAMVLRRVANGAGKAKKAKPKRKTVANKVIRRRKKVSKIRRIERADGAWRTS